MSQSPRKRRWYQLHLVTWFAGLTVAGALMGQNLHVAGPSDPLLHFFLGLDGVFEYGWPTTFMIRQKQVSGLMVGNPSPWLFDDTPIQQFSLSWLSFNIAVAMALLIGTTFTTEQVCRRLSISLRFSVKAMLVVTAWAAICLAVFQNSRYFHFHLESFLVSIAMAVILVAILLTCFTLFDLIGYLFNRLTRSRQ